LEFQRVIHFAFLADHRARTVADALTVELALISLLQSTSRQIRSQPASPKRENQQRPRYYLGILLVLLNLSMELVGSPQYMELVLKIIL